MFVHFSAFTISVVTIVSLWVEGAGARRDIGSLQLASRYLLDIESCGVLLLNSLFLELQIEFLNMETRNMQQNKD